MKAEQENNIIAKIYDAALLPALWLEVICQRHSKIDPFYLKNGEVKLTPLISY